MTELSVLDFQAPRRTFAGPPHGCELNEKTGVCVFCDAGLLHKIHMEAAEAAFQERHKQRWGDQPIKAQQKRKAKR